MDESKKQLARDISRGYPVTAAYVEAMLELFNEAQVRALLDFYSSVGHYPNLDDMKRMLKKGLGWKK